jgi:hypothetical protein
MAERRELPRNHAEQRFETAKQIAFAQRDGENNALHAKTERLRALRLAKEARTATLDD